MNEIALSNNLPQIESEIREEKENVGKSFWEIGRRLNHVKENDLAHGQFLEWLKTMDIERTLAHRMMKVAKELPNVATLQHLGNRVLYLLATLPDESRQEQIEKIEQGDTPTVKELQEVKRKLKLKDQALEAVKGEKSKAYRDNHIRAKAYHAINKEIIDRFGVRRKEIPAKEFKNAVIFIENWGLNDPELKNEIFTTNHQGSLFEA